MQLWYRDPASTSNQTTSLSNVTLPRESGHPSQRGKREDKVLLGLQFVLEEADGFGLHAGAIQAFVSKRNDQLADWKGTKRSAS